MFFKMSKVEMNKQTRENTQKAIGLLKQKDLIGFVLATSHQVPEDADGNDVETQSLIACPSDVFSASMDELMEAAQRFSTITGKP